MPRKPRPQYAFLVSAENRESFFRRIRRFLPERDPRYQLIRRAYGVAKDAFRHIHRERGERYFEHLRAVALILIDHLRVRDHTLIIAALLHDIVEDVEHWTIARVDAEFGSEVALLVEWLTKPNKKEYPCKEERDRVYHDRFRFAPRKFFFIKLADRLHNLLTLDGCSAEKRLRKIEETRREYLPYAERELILLHELEAALEEARSSCVK